MYVALPRFIFLGPIKGSIFPLVVIMPDGSNKTFAEMALNEKESLDKLMEFLSNKD